MNPCVRDCGAQQHGRVDSEHLSDAALCVGRRQGTAWIPRGRSCVLQYPNQSSLGAAQYAPCTSQRRGASSRCLDNQPADARAELPPHDWQDGQGAALRRLKMLHASRVRTAEVPPDRRRGPGGGLSKDSRRGLLASLPSAGCSARCQMAA